MELTKSVYRRVTVLIDESKGEAGNPWGIKFATMFHMANDSHLFRTREQLEADGGTLKGNIFECDEERYLPLYEAKMIHQFDHRFSHSEQPVTGQRIRGSSVSISDEQHSAPQYFAMPRYWVAANKIQDRFQNNWALIFRDVTGAVANVRTTVATIIGEAAIGHKAPIIIPDDRTAAECASLLANLNSFVFDYFARQKVTGLSMSYFILKQLPTISPKEYQKECTWAPANNLRDWILSRVLELTYTASDLQAFARDCGYLCPPFMWNKERRFMLRCELDAAFFHLYGIHREFLSYIMETFPIVRRRDEKQYGEYRTKRLTLEIYDAMQRAKDTGQPYQTHLNPSPGPPPTADGSFISMYQLDRANWPTHIHPPHPDWDESILDAWFDVCRRQWNYLEEDQIFPWDSRETFIYALIPYLIQEKPGAKFEFYRDAASLASCPERLETLLLDDNLRNEYRQLIFDSEWMRFPKDHRIRPRLIRETLQNKQIIQTAADSGTTTIHSSCSLPPLPSELKPLVTLILTAAVNLDKMQRHALEDAEAAKMTFTRDELANELKALCAA